MIRFLALFGRKWQGFWQPPKALNDASPQIPYLPLKTPAAGGAVTGTFATTLGAIVMAASGKVTVKGAFATTLAPFVMVSSGKVSVTGSFSTTLAAVAMTATGKVATTGAFSTVLGAVTMDAAGTVETEQEQHYGGHRLRRRQEDEDEAIRKQWELLDLRLRDQKTGPSAPTPAPIERAAVSVGEVAAAREALQQVLREAEQEAELELVQIAMLAVIAVDDD